MNCIKIKDSADGCLTVKLIDILNYIDGYKYVWTLSYLWAVGNTDLDKGVLDIEKKSKLDTGFELSWNELQKFSSSISQVIDGLFVAVNPNEKFKKYKKDEDYYNNYPFTIEACDSSYWIVSSQDETLILKLKDKYTDIEIM